MQRANSNDCSIFLYKSPEWLAIKSSRITFKEKGSFLPAALLNYIILLPQNTFKAKSIAAFKKWLDLSFKNFAYQRIHNTVQIQPLLHQVPKLLIAMRKKDTLKPFTVSEDLPHVTIGKKWTTCIFGLTTVWNSRWRNRSSFLPSTTCRTVTTLISHHSSEHTWQISPFIHYSMSKCNTEEQRHFSLSLEALHRHWKCIFLTDKAILEAINNGARYLAIGFNASIPFVQKLITYSKQHFQTNSIT